MAFRVQSLKVGEFAIGDPDRGQLLLEHIDRGIGFKTTTLAAGRAQPPFRHNGHVTDFSGIAKGAAIRRTVLDDAKTEADTKIDHAEIGNRETGSKQPFADCCSRRIILHHNGMAASLAKRLSGIDTCPT
ncbi:hypothetical protein D3C80_1005510 [compost metagenome]